jgi:hypothetical protein
MKRRTSGVAIEPIKQTKVPCTTAKKEDEEPVYAVTIAFEVDVNGYPLPLTKAGGRHYVVIRGALGDTVTARAVTFPYSDGIRKVHQLSMTGRHGKPPLPRALDQRS